MKTQVSAFLAMALMASGAWAQTTSQTKASVEEATSVQGFRISLLRPHLDAKSKADYKGNHIEESLKIDSTIGLALGYAKLPVRELGWTTNLAMMEFTAEDEKVNFVRADGNLAYAFNGLFNMKGGLNAQKYISGRGVKDFGVGIGFQAGVGFQVNRNFGLEIGYTDMNSSGRTPVYQVSTDREIDRADMAVKLSGIEIGLNATF